MDRFGAYQEILASIPKSFLPGRDSSTSALEQILPKAVRSCKGNVLYSVHRVENNKIRYMWCGPEELQFLRLETKELPMSQGCMGKTVELGVPFKIWNNVRKSADSKKVFVDSAPDHTQSELVVIMPSTTNAQVLEILNLESDVLDAFDNIDAQAFWAIGMWASLLRSSQDALEDQRGILKEVSRILAGTSILTSDEDPSKPGRFRPSLVQTLRRSIPFDAISVISFTPQELLGTLTVDYHDGFGEDPLVLDGFADDWESFSALVLKERGVITATGGEKVSRLQEYRSETEAAIGAPLNASAATGRRSALVLEFDEPKNFSQREQEATEELAELVGNLVSQQQRIRSGASLVRTLESLPRLALLQERSESYSELLEKATEIIAKSLRATGCGFFEEVEIQSGKKMIQKVAFFIDENSNGERDAFWVRYLNANWMGERHRLFSAFDEGKSVDHPLEVDPSIPNGPRHYRFFAQPIDLLGRKLLLVSFKAISQSRVLGLEMSSTSLQILRAILDFLRARISGMRSEEERRMMEAGLAMALQLAFREDSREGKSESDLVESLFGRVHKFLGEWSEVADARYSAIFLRDRERERLRLSEASMKWLLGMARSEGRCLKKKIERPSLSLKDSGLTASAFQTGRSKFTLQVAAEGSTVCKKFWKEITGREASHRFFAGAQIPNPDGEPFGVLTLNGVPRVTFQDLREEWRWRLLPVLEAVAKELGRAMSRIQNRG